MAVAPSTKSMVSCRPAVPPPPVTGGAVGMGLGLGLGDGLGVALLGETMLGDSELDGCWVAVAVPAAVAVLDDPVLDDPVLDDAVLDACALDDVPPPRAVPEAVGDSAIVTDAEMVNDGGLTGGDVDVVGDAEVQPDTKATKARMMTTSAQSRSLPIAITLREWVQ